MTNWIEFFGQPLVHRIGWVLLHFLWQGTVILAVWTILRSLLRTSDPRTRYAVACLLLGLMAAAPLLTFTLLKAPAAAFSAAAGGIGIAESTFSMTTSGSPVHGAMPLPAVTAQVAAALEGALPWLVTLWSFGVCLLSARLIRGYWSVRSVRSRHIRPLAGVWLERLADLQQRLSLCRPVLLFESALIQVPAVIGWFRPMILVPASSLSGLTPAQLELILAHELAHIRRHDHWVNLLQVLIETLLFYHPAVWWISRDIRAERELCCDDLAVAVCGNRLAYARALTTLEGLRHPPTAMAMGAGGGSLIDRIRHIVGRSASTVADCRRPIGGALLGLGTLLFAAGIACLALSPKQHIALCRVAQVAPDGLWDVFQQSRTLPDSPPYDPYFITTEFEKIKSRPVLDRVIEELRLDQRWGADLPGGTALTRQQAYDELKRSIDVRQVRDTGLIEIRVYQSARGRPAEETAEIANKIAEVYAAHRADWRNASRQRGIQALDQQLERQGEIVRDLQSKVDDLKVQHRISDLSGPTTGSTLDAETVRRLEAERVPLQASYQGMAQLLVQLQSMRANSGSHGELRHGILSANPDADLSKLCQDLWATEASLAKERITKGPEHPDCRALAAMQSQLARTVDDRIEGMLRGLEVRTAAYKAQLDSMQKAVEDAKNREAEMAERYYPYFVAKRDLENQQKLRDAILLRKLQETVDLQIPIPQWNWAVVDPAVPSLRPVQTRLGLGLGLCAAGLATGLSGLLVRASARPPKIPG
jgi:beta-lactamase regulating signal transducer with metallopeptidase domain/uncharacterized protein involved in exopolysaccharide biosynthesis